METLFGSFWDLPRTSLTLRKVTSSLALALIGCRIIAQQLGMAAMDCPINPWAAWRRISWGYQAAVGLELTHTHTEQKIRMQVAISPKKIEDKITKSTQKASCSSGTSTHIHVIPRPKLRLLQGSSSRSGEEVTG